MRVMFLGAGASMHRAYPLTSELLKHIALEMGSTSSNFDRTAWERFDTFRRNATGLLRSILNSNDPEIVLTLPDLLQAAHDRRILGYWNELASGSPSDHWWEDPAMGDLLQGGQTIKDAFSQVVDSFFSVRHAKEWRNTYDGYFCTALAPLSQGDTIITTNWDTLAERVLWQMRKWSPRDGYGFPKKFTVSDSSVIPEYSPVKVLKLHGSVGWFGSAGAIYLRQANYLQYMFGSSIVKDISAPPNEGIPISDPVMIFPSYLKQLQGPIFQAIWSQASMALMQAETITVIGYSLPEADMAIRVLLNPARQRLTEGLVTITVVDKDPLVHDRWRELLGTGVNHIQDSAESYFQPPMGNDETPQTYT